MEGDGPWWVSMGNNADTLEYPDSNFIVGDEGLVIRSYAARLGGEELVAPSYSVVCDKLEIGVPADLRGLEEGDYVELAME